MVPEIFAPLPDPPEHSEAIVIGSGFGGSVSALRLAQAGVEVTVLERGSRWPNHPWREIFMRGLAFDGRGFWYLGALPNLLPGDLRQSFPPIDLFGGVLDINSYRDMAVMRAAAVGGGSVVYSGAMLEPEQHLFDETFGGLVDYQQMHDVYYPRVRKVMRLSPMPDDIYNSDEFGSIRAWDNQVRAAGFSPQRVDSAFNWEVLRAEMNGQARPSASIGESMFGCSNGAKFDLGQNYLRYAEETGKARIYPGHIVKSIAVEPDGRFSVLLTKAAASGEVLATRTLTCDTLFLAANSIGTSELLVRAQATGALPNLNEFVGQGWGPNGDSAMIRFVNDTDYGPQSAIIATRILDESRAPTSLENFMYVPLYLNYRGLLCSLAMTLDPTRGSFVYNAATDRVDLNWAGYNSGATLAAATELNRKAVGGQFRLAIPHGSARASPHPLGGAVLGQATDGYGRVHGYRGLYVMDGAALPGTSGTVNPSLTIAALAERNIEQIIRAGG